MRSLRPDCPESGIVIRDSVAKPVIAGAVRKRAILRRGTSHQGFPATEAETAMMTQVTTMASQA